MRFLLRCFANSGALYLADRLLAGFSLNGGIWSYLVGGVTIGLLFTFLRPILKLITSPFILITFGLFNFIIVIGLVWLADFLLPQLTINGLSTLILTSLFIEFANIAVPFSS